MNKGIKILYSKYFRTGLEYNANNINEVMCYKKLHLSYTIKYYTIIQNYWNHNER